MNEQLSVEPSSSPQPGALAGSGYGGLQGKGLNTF